LIEYFKLNIEYLRSACGESILKRPIKNMTEQSDIHKSSIFNSPMNRDLRFSATGLSGSDLN